MFLTPSWTSVLLGQNIWPERYDPVANALVAEHVDQALNNMRRSYEDTAEGLPTHEQFLRHIGAWAVS